MYVPPLESYSWLGDRLLNYHGPSSRPGEGGGQLSTGGFQLFLVTEKLLGYQEEMGRRQGRCDE